MAQPSIRDFLDHSVMFRPQRDLVDDTSTRIQSLQRLDALSIFLVYNLLTCEIDRDLQVLILFNRLRPGVCVCLESLRLLSAHLLMDKLAALSSFVCWVSLSLLFQSQLESDVTTSYMINLIFVSH